MKNKIKKDKEVSTAQPARGILSGERTLDDTLRVKQKWEKVILSQHLLWLTSQSPTY